MLPWITAATSLMTKFEGYTSSNDLIQAIWRKPVYLPTHFELSVKCRQECNDEIYLSMKLILRPNTTTQTVSGLVPRSQCCFTLKAVYNPASIDKGIKRTFTNSPSGKLLLEMCDLWSIQPLIYTGQPITIVKLLHVVKHWYREVW